MRKTYQFVKIVQLAKVTPFSSSKVAIGDVCFSWLDIAAELYPTQEKWKLSIKRKNHTAQWEELMLAKPQLNITLYPNCLLFTGGFLAMPCFQGTITSDWPDFDTELKTWYLYVVRKLNQRSILAILSLMMVLETLHCKCRFRVKSSVTLASIRGTFHANCALI